MIDIKKVLFLQGDQAKSYAKEIKRLETTF